MNRSRRRAALAALALLAAGLLSPLAAPGRIAAEAQELPPAGQEVEAVPRLAAAFATDPESPAAREALWNLARRSVPSPQLVEAIRAAAPALGPDGWAAAGVLLRRALRPLDALEAFERAAANAGPAGSAAADIEAGRLFAELRSNERALARFARRPEHPAAIHGRAVVLARERRTEEAVALTETLLRQDPGNAAALLLHAELLDSVGRGSETLDTLRRLAAETGTGGPAAFRLARILVRLGKPGEAVPLLQAILAAAPGNAEAWLALGRAHRSLDRREAAAEAFRRALAEDPALNEARIALARLLAQGGGREEAERLFAEFERRKGIGDASGRLLGEAELQPGDFPRVSAFVVHALQNRDFPLALRGAQRFLVEFPEQPERHLLLARVFREGGRRADAERVLRRGLRRFAGEPAATRRFEAALRAIGVR